MPASASVARAGVMAPTAEPERLPLLDAVRGVALGGILLANLTSFYGADMLDTGARDAQPAAAAGRAVLVGIDWLVEGKFYSVFSMLFGIGFALQAQRAEAHGTAIGPFFRRRMATLVAIGATHMYALWAGDILLLYGVAGLLLPSLWRWPPAARTAAMTMLFAVPFATHVIVVESRGVLDPRTPFAALGATLQQAFGIAGRETLDLFARGTSVEYWAWNTAYAAVRPGTYLQSGRAAKVLALFLLGTWIARHGWLNPPVRHGALRRIAWLGGATGLAGSAVYAMIKAETRSTFLVSTTGLVQTAAYTVGTTPLALAYLALASLAWATPRWRPRLEWFVPLGRMALTVYLSQTIFHLLVFTSHGARMAGRLPIATLPLVALALFVVQRQACRWWLSGHAQGPIEALWRRAAYGGPRQART